MELTTLAVGSPAFAIFLVWEWRDGGFAATDWLLGGLFLLGLLVTVLVTVGGIAGTGRALRVSVLCLLGFTIWNGCSIAWAGVRGIAWDGTNRTVLYLCVFVLFALLPWPRRTTALLLGAYAAGVAGLAALAFFRSTGENDPLSAFVSGRLAVPLEYPNADAALFLAALWPALYLAARRETPPLLRGLMLAAAGVLVDLSLLCQSRGSLVALPATGLVYLLIIPTRLRLIAIGVPLAAITALGAPTLIRLNQAILHARGAADAVADSRSTVVHTALALFFVGAILGLVDRHVALPPRVIRSVGAGLSAVVLLAVGATTIGVVAFGHPIDRVTTGWNSFKADEENDAVRPHFITGLGSQRYDLWRVSLIEFRDQPIAGIGSDNFAAPYLRLRRTVEEPLYPHGLPFRLAAGTGSVGILLFLGWLAAALSAFRGAARSRSRDAQALACSAFALTLYWLIQGSVDWFWEIPALGAPAFAALGLALRTTDRPSLPAVGRISPRMIGAVAAVALVPAVSFTCTWLAAREVETAASTWASGSKEAFDRLDLARKLNPLSDNADAVAGVIARRLGDRTRQRTAFSRAVSRNPSNWYGWLELAMLDAGGSRQAAALEEAERARFLNPHDPLVAQVERKVRRGQKIDAAAVERAFTARLRPLLRGR